MKRRTVVQASVLAATSLPVHSLLGQDASGQEIADISSITGRFTRPLFIATWNFGQAACEKSRHVLASGGSLKDAVERGINVTELDASNHSVGYGGYPNADGIVQLDACFMDGQRQQAGAVAALEGYPNPISVARRVMETTKHVMLAGEDAAQFAKQAGFPSQSLLTPEAKQAWMQWREKQAHGQASPIDSHDTISLLGVDDQGNLVGGCSTSGLAFKLPGRVGDSPIIGSGLYVDGQVGAAGATGVGENILRYCGCFLIVEYMRQGMSPTDACIATIRRIASGDQKPASELSVNFVAVSKTGQVGAAGTDAGFRCAIVDNQQSLVARPVLVR